MRTILLLAAMAFAIVAGVMIVMTFHPRPAYADYSGKTAERSREATADQC